MVKSLVSHNGFIMRVFLAFVFIWFGISEINNPDNFSGYIPSSFSNLGLDENLLVQIHGGVLVLLSFCLIFKFYLSVTGLLAVLIMIQIIFGLMLVNNFQIDDIIARDIGILGLAIGVWLNALRN
ncbi:MAG: hypothetical protein AAB583_03040 [Patescibacteria group bacterium]